MYLLCDLLHGVCMQEILGGQYVAVEKYDAQFFPRFRSENIVELTVDYARVSCFLTHLSCDVD